MHRNEHLLDSKKAGPILSRQGRQCPPRHSSNIDYVGSVYFRPDGKDSESAMVGSIPSVCLLDEKHL